MAPRTSHKKAPASRTSNKNRKVTPPNPSGFAENYDADVPGRTRGEHFIFSDAATIVGIKFRQDEQPLDGVRLCLSVDFSTHGVPDKQKWEIWPYIARVRLEGSHGRPGLTLGEFHSSFWHSITPSSDPYKPQTRDVPFVRCFSAVEMTKIEKWREGNDLKVIVNVNGLGHRGTFLTWSYFSEFSKTIARSEWSDLLAAAHVLDDVHLAIPVRDDLRVAEGVKHLRTALAQHVRGDYSGVAQACRKAIDELGIAGFSARPPREVAQFIGNRTEREEYTLEDRTAVVLSAAHMLLHSGSHGGPEERRWQRGDADLVLALTAALLQVAPDRLRNTEPANAAASHDATGKENTANGTLPVRGTKT